MAKFYILSYCMFCLVFCALGQNEIIADKFNSVPMRNGAIQFEFGTSKKLQTNPFTIQSNDTVVYSISSGLVAQVISEENAETGGAKYIFVKYTDDTSIRYSKLESVCVVRGDLICKGDVIGKPERDDATGKNELGIQVWIGKPKIQRLYKLSYFGVYSFIKAMDY